MPFGILKAFGHKVVVCLNSFFCCACDVNLSMLYIIEISGLKSVLAARLLCFRLVTVAQCFMLLTCSSIIIVVFLTKVID